MRENKNQQLFKAMEQTAEGLFGPWLQFVLENEDRLEKPTEPDYDTVQIDNSQILAYPQASYPLAGIWLQTQDGHIRIYISNQKNEGIFHRHVQRDMEPGPMHQHDAIEVGYVVSGCARQEFFGREYRFNAGDFWIVDQNCYHCDIYSYSDLLTVFISISSEVFDSAFLRTVENSDIHRFLCLALLKQKKNRQFLHFSPRRKEAAGPVVMEQLLREVIEKKAGYETIVRGLLERLLNSLSTEYDFSLSSQEKRQRNDLLFHEIEKYIHDNYATASIQCLVERFHYNEDFYNRLIKAYSGHTYSGYLKRVRMEEACRLLLHTHQSIEQIALTLGYQSRAHFYRVFSEYFGMTPASFRKEKQENKRETPQNNQQ